MKLQPKRQPGRIDRKAAAYAGDIVQLRVDGYTYAAIREALSAVGIELSESGLRREVRRHQTRPAFELRGVPARSTTPDAQAMSASQTLRPEPAASIGATGRDVAEAFFSAHPGNPLLRPKETP